MSGVSPTYVRALIVSMCSACVASVPESHSWLLRLILSSSRVSHGPLLCLDFLFSVCHFQSHLAHVETMMAPHLSLTSSYSLKLLTPALKFLFQVFLLSSMCQSHGQEQTISSASLHPQSPSFWFLLPPTPFFMMLPKGPFKIELCHQGNANQTHKEILLHAHLDGYNKKDK